MTIHNVSKNWKYCNNIMYDCSDRKWFSDFPTISDNQKKMEWNKLTKSMDVKSLSFPQKISLGGNYDVRPNRKETT